MSELPDTLQLSCSDIPDDTIEVTPLSGGFFTLFMTESDTESTIVLERDDGVKLRDWLNHWLTATDEGST